MTSAIKKALPYYARGPVIKGFGRGSKEIGIPTANFEEKIVDQLPTVLSTGIYYGWASLPDGAVHKMVMSIGWNPYYGNEKRSMETHIMHKFDEDFYGEVLNVIIVGYIREEKNFSGLDDLIQAIRDDITFAEDALDGEESQMLKSHPFLQGGSAASKI